jgi:hypothetical protein
MKLIKKLKSKFVNFHQNNRIVLCDFHKSYRPPAYNLIDELEDVEIKIYPEFIEITGFRVKTEYIIDSDNFGSYIYNGRSDEKINIILNQYKIEL